MKREKSRVVLLPKPSISVNKIIKQAKEDYLEHGRSQTTSQSRMNFYLTLKIVYELAEYLFSVRDTKQEASPDHVQAQ